MSLPANRWGHSSKTRPRLWFIVLAVLILPGCNSFKFVYGFADNMIESRAEDYLDLDSAQRAELEEQSAALLAWHRREMLPKYATYFNAQANLAKTGWARGQMRDAVVQFRTLMDETVKGASPYIAHVLSGHMKAEKLAFLEARMADYVTERRTEEEAESPEDSLEEWVERRAKAIARFTGPLNEKQLAIIRSHTPARTDGSPRWLENREKRHAALIAFLRTQPSHEETAHFVYRIALRAHEITDGEYRDHSNAYWALLEDVYFDVMATLTHEQRSKLISNLRGYASDMVDLSASS